MVIHESNVRDGYYDDALLEAENDMLEFSVPDLSPVTIAKVTVDNVSALDLIAEAEASYRAPGLETTSTDLILSDDNWSNSC